MTTEAADDSAAAPCGTSLRITDQEFARFQKYIHQHSGIYLSPVKKALVVARLGKRVTELGLRSFTDYFRVISSDARESGDMLERMCTHETHFFREPQQFTALTSAILPRIWMAGERGLRPKRIRVWSAGCSTGEEPVSLAMVLLDRFGCDGRWSIEILASDFSLRALRATARGVWPLRKKKEIPETYLKRFMLRGVRAEEGLMAAGPEVRNVLTLARINLNEAEFAASLGSFDLIFCRNVLIYFDLEGKRRVIDTLLRSLTPDGHLFLGHSESASSLGVAARTVGPSMLVPRSSTV